MPAIARFFAFLCLVALLPVRVAAAGDIPEEKRFVFLSSTIGPIEAGIVPALEEAFEKETGIRVRHVGAGTGAALKMAEGGQIDLVLAHAWSLEEKFVKDGFGTRRVPMKFGAPLFFPNSTEYRKAAGLPAGDF
jgi:tungstate transport system substrate-binding protein